MLAYSLRLVLVNDGEQETPCHPSSNAHYYITFMSVNTESQKFSTCSSLYVCWSDDPGYIIVLFVYKLLDIKQ